MLEPPRPHAQLIQTIQELQPKFLLVSLALAEQQDGLAKIAQSTNAIATELRPMSIVGGNAVKSGMVTPIQDSVFLSDLKELERMVLKQLGYSKTQNGVTHWLRVRERDPPPADAPDHL